LIIGAYKASANDTKIVNNKKLNKPIPKNIGIGPRVAIVHPIKMRLYGLYYAWIGVSKRRKIIINKGATAMYSPKGASGPSS